MLIIISEHILDCMGCGGVLCQKLFTGYSQINIDKLPFVNFRHSTVNISKEVILHFV